MKKLYSNDCFLYPEYTNFFTVKFILRSEELKKFYIFNDDGFASLLRRCFHDVRLFKYMSKQNRELFTKLITKDHWLLLSSFQNEAHTEIIKYLIKSGADLQKYDNWPLIYALQEEKFDAVRIIVKSGINLKLSSTELMNVMAWLFENRSPEKYDSFLKMIKFLVKNGVIVTDETIKYFKEEDAQKLLNRLRKDQRF
jgi:hypothetical protein